MGDGWTEITREDQYGDGFQSTPDRIDKDSWFADSDLSPSAFDGSDDVQFTWDDELDGMEIRRDWESNESDDSNPWLPQNERSRGRSRPPPSPISNRRSPRQSSYDLETDEY